MNIYKLLGEKLKEYNCDNYIIRTDKNEIIESFYRGLFETFIKVNITNDTSTIKEIKTITDKDLQITLVITVSMK